MIENLKGKYIFFDIDGTLSEYRHNNQIYGSKCPELGCLSLKDLLFSDLFLKARPLKTMQKIINQLDSEKIYILGAITTNNEINCKYKWLEINYPNIKKENIIFISSTMLKPDVIIEYAQKLNISVKDTVLIDDRLDVLRKAEELEIIAYHISSFIE